MKEVMPELSAKWALPGSHGIRVVEGCRVLPSAMFGGRSEINLVKLWPECDVLRCGGALALSESVSGPICLKEAPRIRAMSDFLPKEVMDGLRAAQKKAERKRSRRSVHVGDDVYPILQFAEEGFALDAEYAPHLRGLVDIYEGPKHLYQALIVASEIKGDLMRYEFKRNTVASDHAPRDFYQEQDAPIALLDWSKP
jgi:hypothetical protein